MSEYRNERVAGEIHRLMTELVYSELKDPLIPEFMSVNEVRMNRDLSLATIYVSTLGDEQEKNNMMKGLEKAKGYLRKRVAETINLRLAPELRFVLDESLERGNRMDALIEKVRAEDKAEKEKFAQKLEDVKNAKDN